MSTLITTNGTAWEYATAATTHNDLVWAEVDARPIVWDTSVGTITTTGDSTYAPITRESIKEMIREILLEEFPCLKTDIPKELLLVLGL